jgi:signal transduction histidine kinase
LPESALPAIEPLLEDAQALLADTSAGIRDICTNLRPATLDYAGLIPALQDYTRQFSTRSGARAQFEHARFDAILPKNIESLLFRIAQEALANSTKHALASNILIELSNIGQKLVMRITDDGIGFNPESLGVNGRTPGLGLITMRERAEFAGGVFKVNSHKGRGTEITVTFDDITMTGYNISHPQRRASDIGGAV